MASSPRKATEVAETFRILEVAYPDAVHQIRFASRHSAEAVAAGIAGKGFIKLDGQYRFDANEETGPIVLLATHIISVS
jgi:hypothetical protein